MNPDAIKKAREILKGRQPRYWAIVMMKFSNPSMTNRDIAIGVGLSEKTADVQISRILKDPDVRSALGVLQEEAAVEAGVTLNDWYKNQKKILDCAMGMYTVKKKLGKGKDAQEVSLDIMVDSKEANKAQENLAKAAGFFSDKKKGEKRVFHYVQNLGGKEDIKK